MTRRHPAARARVVTGVVSLGGLVVATAAMAAGSHPESTPATTTVAADVAAASTTTTVAVARAVPSMPARTPNSVSHGS